MPPLYNRRVSGPWVAAGQICAGRTGESDKLASEEVEAPEEQAAEGRARPRRTRLILIAAAVLLLIGAGGGWWLLGSGGHAQEVAEAGPVDAESLVDVPAMTVNLRTPDGVPKMLRVHLMLVPGSAAKETVEGQLPLIIDAAQPFLRELRPEDIAGSAATFRVKEELLVRANLVLGRGSVRDVLIQDLVQQ